MSSNESSEGSDVEIADRKPNCSAEGLPSDMDFTFQCSPSLSVSLEPRSPKSPSHLPEPSESTLKTDNRHSLDSFLRKISSKEKAEMTKHEFEVMAKHREKRQEQKERDDRETLLDKCEKGKKRQQDFRDRKKAEKIANGETDKRGKVSNIVSIRANTYAEIRNVNYKSLMMKTLLV